jgi:hypothetical protein
VGSRDSTPDTNDGQPSQREDNDKDNGNDEEKKAEKKGKKKGKNSKLIELRSATLAPTSPSTRSSLSPNKHKQANAAVIDGDDTDKELPEDTIAGAESENTNEGAIR